MISIQNLSKSFGDLLAVDQLTLDIQAGEILGFLGPNGAGKTTTIQMLCGLLEKDSGEIFWNGNRSIEKEAIGFCPQENVFWPRLTCLEQMTFAGRTYGMVQGEALQRAKDLLDTLGLGAKQGVLASKLSGGMKRRLNVALAMIHNPDILIFDEPESGLDPQSRLLVRDLIRDLAYKKTVVVTSHNMDEVERLAHRVAIIDHGKLLKLDTIEGLKSSVGEGDLLEITIPKNTEPASLEKAMAALQEEPVKVGFRDRSIQIRAQGITEQVSKHIETIKRFNIEIENIQIRKNSLEDVFIHLTGRGLRE